MINILKSIKWKTENVKWCDVKVPQYILTVTPTLACPIPSTWFL